jgi:pimeloyl-ACP methyl ester carboxylesterase
MIASIWKPSEKLRGVEKRALVYFVCGNPGLIGFYVDFLDALRNLLNTSQLHTAYDIYGRNLLGFCDDEHEPFGPSNPPWDVDGQVAGMYKDVASRRVSIEDGTGNDKPYDFVILMGHSIGAYICVEIFHRHMQDPSRAPHLNLRHGFLLFPTIASLALSQSGVRMNYLRSLPTMETHFITYAKALLGLFPQSTLQWIIENIMGFSTHGAAVTAEWLKSRDGVLQALHMGKSELDTIFEDKWDDELWEVSVASKDLQSPRFFMFYGREDHWVANHVRDAFIERRRKAGEKGGNTSITVDEGNIQHAFCTKEGKPSLFSSVA